MNTSYRIIPCYTGDVSGVCSALFELGGMVVIHDPSGCNSTYNTHDETRWYDHDSLIFISGLAEIDAVFGNDDKLIDDTVDAALNLHPRFITLVNSPIPYLNGTDFEAISRIIESRTGIPTFYIPTNGMHDYVTGAGAALAEIAKRFVNVPEETVPNSVNLLGVTPLDFAGEKSPESLRSLIESAGFSVRSCWAMGDTLDKLSGAGGAAVNLVVSAVGLRAAKVLRERCGTPYVVGTPLGKFSEMVFDSLKKAVGTGENQFPLRERNVRETSGVYAIGEPVTMGSVLSALDLPGTVLCPLEDCEAFFGNGTIAAEGEEEAENALKDAKVVIADPLYRPIIPKGAKMIDLPHEAFSGRCFRKTMKNLFTIDFDALRKEASL